MINYKDTYLFFCENHYIQELEMLFLLGVDKKDDVNYLFLIENGYLKNDNRGLYAFDFVGVIVFKEKVLCIFPKYFSQADLNNDEIRNNNFTAFIRIVKALKKFSRTDRALGEFNLIVNNVRENELTIADELIKDYISYGIYKKEKEEIAINSEGEINWDSTINSLQPFFSKRKPIYIDTFSSITLIEDEYIITQLHKWAIKYSYFKYGALLDYNLRIDDFAVNDYSEIGEKEFLLKILQKELNEVFIDRNIRLIKLLRSLLTLNYDQKHKGVSLYGTNSFHVIWEKACSIVFNNKRDTDKFKGKIPKPEWRDLSGNPAIEKSTIIPDIICVKENSFFIIDAKYYNIKIHNDASGQIKVYDNPGIADVTKQLLYEHSFKDAFNTEYSEWYNIFAFPYLLQEPGSECFWRIFGTVKLNMGVFSKENIWLIYLDANSIFKAYLSNGYDYEKQLGSISAEIDRLISMA